MSTDPSLAAWGDYDRDNPFPLFRSLRAAGPVHQVTLTDGHDAWLVVGHAEARSALNDPRISKDMHAALAASGAVVAEGLPGPAFARHMLAVDPPDHTRLRRLVAAAFSVRRIEALEGAVRGIVDSLLDTIEACGADTVVDLVAAFAFPLPFTVICELLGVPEVGRTRFGQSLVAMLTPARTDEEQPRAKEASDAVVQFLTDLVADKRRDPDDALVSALIRARDDDRLTEQELMSTVFQLIVAGHDTTSSLIGNGVVALLTHPDELARVRLDPDLLEHAVEELIRFDAPVPHSTFRYALDEVDLGGTKIPAGAQVIMNLASANRDPAHYEDPDGLDVGRADVRHLGFGHGIHFCLGAPLARMEGRLAFGGLLGRFPDLRLAVPPDELRWGHGDGLVLRGLTALPVVAGRPAHA